MYNLQLCYFNCSQMNRGRWAPHHSFVSYSTNVCIIDKIKTCGSMYQIKIDFKDATALRFGHGNVAFDPQGV